MLYVSTRAPFVSLTKSAALQKSKEIIGVAWAAASKVVRGPASLIVVEQYKSAADATLL